ncbi:hypothetical protein RFI_30081 [Reticulomyxa filosa]|uniref:Caspase family p20 domain-containing protein n=1 Tax=Reticulomyxa filosa TaxID=46433 RepID=X6M131_RETFI|nr:hypothetical protein RFI_30081 [Reticulomyxa filosa]|eukprot:ETO07311.1 hypothetical protein RFI_30081 [Reticulomyxa filosa]
MSNQNTTQKQRQTIIALTAFQDVKNVSSSLALPQCVRYKREILICGGDVLITSEGDKISIDEIRASFGCRQMKDYPKIFIIDVCRGNINPQEACSRIKGKNENQQNNSHNGYGFLVIWSKTKGYQVNDSAFFSEMVVFLHQMLRNVTKKTGGAYYCVESQDTTAYDIIFQQRKSTFCIGNM